MGMSKWNSGKNLPPKKGIYIGQINDDGDIAESDSPDSSTYKVPKRVISQRKIQKVFRKKIRPYSIQAVAFATGKRRPRRRKGRRGPLGRAIANRRGGTTGMKPRRIRTTIVRQGKSPKKASNRIGWGNKVEADSDSRKTFKTRKKHKARKYRREHSYVYFDGKKFLNIYRSSESTVLKWRECSRREQLSATKVVWKYPS